MGSFGTKIRKFIKIAKDSLFPKYCLGCDKEGFVLCKDCDSRLAIDKVMLCPICKKEDDQGMCCSNCKKHSYLDLHVSIFEYEGLKAQLIEELKYQYIIDVLDIFEKYVSKFVEKNRELFADNAVIIPVPLHKKRYAERGFNQAKLIADILAEELDLEVKKLLKRTRNTTQQVKLSKDKRENNLKGAFETINLCSIKQNHAILVDDVFTTGSTLQECAKVIEDNFETVAGFTLARGE